MTAIAAALAGDLTVPAGATLVVLALAVARRPAARSRHPTAPPEPAPRPPATRRPVLRHRTGRRAVDAAYADAVELVVLAVRAGHLPASAMRAVQPHVAPVIGEAFAAVTRRVQAGHRFADALAELPAHLGPPAVALADSFAAADRDGLPLAPVLERLAEEARRQRRRRADTSARELPVRLSLPLVLCTLPSFVLLAIVPLLLAALSSLHR